MDQVDIRYRDAIIEALSSGNVEALKEKVPSLSDDEVERYIERYQELKNTTMEKIKASMDTTKEADQQWEIVYTLLDRANLSGYSRR